MIQDPCIVIYSIWVGNEVSRMFETFSDGYFFINVHVDIQ